LDWQDQPAQTSHTVLIEQLPARVEKAEVAARQSMEKLKA